MILPVIIAKEKSILARHCTKRKKRFDRQASTMERQESSNYSGIEYRPLESSSRPMVHLFNRLHGTERSGMFEVEGRC